MFTNKAAGLAAAVIMLFAAQVILLCVVIMPGVKAEIQQREWQGLDLLKKYQENRDMAGWLQVEGTNINYPVMRGDSYLYSSFSGRYDASGSLFVEEDWAEDDMCTLVYGHNMWLNGTMFSQLHRFANGGFFTKNRTAKLYVIKQDGRDAEKRLYEIRYCIRASVDRWNYASCRYICSGEEQAAFMEECRERAVQSAETDDGPDGILVLSTCSYHVGGGKGRLLIVGSLKKTVRQTRIDVQKN